VPANESSRLQLDEFTAQRRLYFSVTFQCKLRALTNWIRAVSAVMLRTNMRYLIVTNCTNRKSLKGLPWDFGPNVGSLDIQGAAEEWVSYVESVRSVEGNRIRVSDLYQGRSMTDVTRLSECIRGTVFVVSAGMGLVSFNDTVIPYNLSVSDRVNPLYLLLKRSGSTPAQWWSAIGALGFGAMSLARLTRSQPEVAVLMALPSTYLAMVVEDLSTLSTHELERIRILTHPASMDMLPQRLQELVMPYDERLQSIREFAGTRSDFAQRALSHFVLGLGAHELPIESAKQAVTRAMERLGHVKLPTRRRAADEEILSHIADHWDRTNGHGNRLLRVLRDDLLISCEQGRFQGLWRKYKAQMDGAKENVT